MREHRVVTPAGEGRLVIHEAAEPVATLLLSHGAGNGIETHDLQALAATLPEQGVTVALFEQPWRVDGRRVAPRGPVLDAGLTAAAIELGLRSDVPFVVGGRSAGARSAARTARGLGAAGCLAIAFPLHAPGKGTSRLGELEAAGVPVLVVQGERDAFGTPEEFPEDLDLAVVPAADHALKPLRSSGLGIEDADAILVEATLEWLFREVIGTQA